MPSARFARTHSRLDLPTREGRGNGSSSEGFAGTDSVVVLIGVRLASRSQAAPRHRQLRRASVDSTSPYRYRPWHGGIRRGYARARNRFAGTRRPHGRVESQGPIVQATRRARPVRAFFSGPTPARKTNGYPMGQCLKGNMCQSFLKKWSAIGVCGIPRTK